MPEKNNTIKILLVDDEPILRDLLYELLSKEDYQVTTVENGKEALFMIQKKPDFFDLIIMDMVMPEMSGINSYDAIKNICPYINILFMSGYFQEQYMQGLEKSERIGFIKKPFRNEEILQKVQNQISR